RYESSVPAPTLFNIIVFSQQQQSLLASKLGFSSLMFNQSDWGFYSHTLVTYDFFCDYDSSHVVHLVIGFAFAGYAAGIISYLASIQNLGDKTKCAIFVIRYRNLNGLFFVEK
ncbi:hypothetical protein ACJX0J_030811, partial [Zea mays]